MARIIIFAAAALCILFIGALFSTELQLLPVMPGEEMGKFLKKVPKIIVGVIEVITLCIVFLWYIGLAPRVPEREHPLMIRCAGFFLVVSYFTSIAVVIYDHDECIFSRVCTCFCLIFFVSAICLFFVGAMFLFLQGHIKPAEEIKKFILKAPQIIRKVIHAVLLCFLFFTYVHIGKYQLPVIYRDYPALFTDAVLFLISAYMTSMWVLMINDNECIFLRICVVCCLAVFASASLHIFHMCSAIRRSLLQHGSG